MRSCRRIGNRPPGRRFVFAGFAVASLFVLASTFAPPTARAEEAPAAGEAALDPAAIEFFEKAEVTAAPVYDIGQFLDDPHVQERGIVVEVPDDDMGAVPMHAIVPRLSGTPGRLRRPAPAVGQHNHEIFSRVGYAEERIAALARKGVI